MNRALLFTAALALCACGPKYTRGVSKELVDKLPYETQIELLESENELAVAVDKADEAHNEVTRTREAIRRAKEGRETAQVEQDQAKDGLGKEVARLAIEEAEARVEYLRARQEANLETVHAEDIALRCAYARYEQARLTAVRKAKVEGSEKLDPKDYEKQTAECEAELKQLRAQQQDGAKKIEPVKAAWEAKKAAYAKKTFDARANPFVE